MLTRSWGWPGTLDALRQAPDAVAVRVAARLRVAIAVTVAATGSFLPDLAPRTATLFVVLGLVWVPWACAVLFAADEAGSPVAQLGGPIGDVVALFAIQALLPGSANAVLLGYLLVVVFTLYTSGRSVAALVGMSTLSLTLVARVFSPAPERVATSALLPFSVALVGLIVLFDRTVTLQRQAAARSERLQSHADAILARVADGVVVTDVASRVLQCNPAAQRIVGLVDHDAVGSHCADVLGLHMGEREVDCSHGCPLLGLENAASLGEEVWRLDGSGRRQPLLANVAPVLDADGNLVEVVHSLRDITRLKQAEEAKTLFLATASHELKTPLTVINGFAETLIRYQDLDPARRIQALESIARRGRELSSIVDRLLLSSRIEAGRTEVSLDEVQVGPVVEERARAMYAATDREVRYVVPGDLPVVVANEAAVTTVVDHLIENAIKYSPGGTPVVVTVRGTDGGDVEIEVADDGIGMDVEQAAHCFDKFWQAESTDVRRFGGTGIGLYIVRSLVEAMRGEVLVRSAPGAGTAFTVVLRRTREIPAQRTGAGVGEATSIREFMRQIGVPAGGGTP